jgi:hypothetical protein
MAAHPAKPNRPKNARPRSAAQQTCPAASIFLAGTRVGQGESTKYNGNVSVPACQASGAGSNLQEPG